MFPIDIVYTWCDGNDPEFKKRKKFYLEKENQIHNDSVGEHRFIDNEELRYSLRSLEMYAPWIRHVFIVTDRQLPYWLNTQYEKVTVVDHSEIMPKSLIPCFSSDNIERHIVNIPGLSEYFLYANDDCFFGRSITSDFFFNANGRPKVYVKYYEKFNRIINYNDFQEKYNSMGSWMRSNMNSWKLLYKQYGKKDFFLLSHTIDAYTKTLFKATLNRYEKEFEETKYIRFRSEKNISRNLFSLDMIYHGDADMEVIKTPSFWQKHIHKSPGYSWKCYCGSEDKKTREQIIRFEPYVFCINANSHSTAKDKRRMRSFYEKLFPKKSHFELDVAPCS